MEDPYLELLSRWLWMPVRRLRLMRSGVSSTSSGPGTHPGLTDAIEQARQNGIWLAISNPCFELWLVLHFQDQSAWLDSDGACRLRRELDASRDRASTPRSTWRFLVTQHDAPQSLTNVTCKTAPPSHTTTHHLTCTASLRLSSRPSAEGWHLLRCARTEAQWMWHCCIGRSG